MSKTRRQHRRKSKTAAASRRNASKRKSGAIVREGRRKSNNHPAQRSGWSGWTVAIVIGVVLGSIAAWWMVSSRVDEHAAAAQPIAAIDAPDYHSLVFDAQNSEHVFFGSHTGTQESRDGGLTWQKGGLTNADAMIMATSPNASETIYVAGHDVFQVSYDSGVSWQPVAHNLPGTDIHGFAQNPNEPQRLYAFVVGAGGLTSEDGGSTWAPFGTQPPGGSYIVLASNGEALYAATDAGLARSGDHGASWIPLANQPDKVTMMSLAVSVTDPQVIYVGTPIGLIRSTDGGTNWSTIGPTNVPTLAIAVAPTDPNRVLILSNTGVIYRSDDRGATWGSGG